MTSIEETLRIYNAKRAVRDAARVAHAAASQTPPKLQTCQQCRAACTGSVQVLGSAMCDSCFNSRLEEQSC